MTPCFTTTPAAPSSSTRISRAPCRGQASASDRLTLIGGSTAQIIYRPLGPLRLAWVPRGPVWPAAGDLARKRVALRDLRAQLPPRALCLITLDAPEDAAALRGLARAPVARGHAIAELDLRPDPAELRARLHGKWRNRLVHAEKGTITLRSRALNPLRDADLLAREAAQRRARGYRAPPPAFALDWARANPRATCLVEARQGTRTVAFMLFLLHGSAATYHAGWSSAAGRATSAHNLTLWHAMIHLRRRSILRLDLGRTSPTHAPGLARFKSGTGAAIRALGPTFVVL